MEKFVIDGGVPLSRHGGPAGNKNAALPILAASVLTAEEVVVRNVPRIRDVEAMLRHPRAASACASSGAARTRSRCCAAERRPTTREVDRAPGRAHPRLVPARRPAARPLRPRRHAAARRRRHRPPPAGPAPRRLPCARRRRYDLERDIDLIAPTAGLRAGDVFMDEPSVMATENALMAAALTPGTTVIGNAACEPHVQDLARMLVKMGADIQGIGSNVLDRHRPRGAGRLHHDVGPDHIEIGSFMALAGVTGGELRIKDTEPDDLRMIRLVFDRLGLRSRARRRRRRRARRPGAHRRSATSASSRPRSRTARGPRSRPT